VRASPACRCGAPLLASLFRADISSELLAELLLALAHGARLLAQEQAAGAGDPERLAEPEQQQAGNGAPQPQPAAAQCRGSGDGQGVQQHGRRQGGGAAGEGCSQAEPALVEVLEALTKAGRFTLSVRLLGAKGRAAVQQLFQDLEALAAAGAPPACADELQARLQGLRRLYGVAGK
jgi:hypothetical protein